MLEKLFEVVHVLPSLIVKPEVWDSLIVNRRKPNTYRVFTKIGDYRVCLHKFNTCDIHEAFRHPHPWPAAFMILSGKYKMWLGQSIDQKTQPFDVSEQIMTKYSSYEIVNPLTWHSIIPLEETYTVMINGIPWEEEIAHNAVASVTGTDLEKMNPDELKTQLKLFGSLIENWKNN